ncbi:hypothetical protein [Luteitalea sp.]
MSHVWHLFRHNLRAHRTILLAWVATVIALPILANLPWSDQAAAGFGVGAAIGLQAARVLLGMAAIASIVQAGHPIDDTAFWRTRPMAPHTVAAAHIVTAAALFVSVPTLVVLLTAVALGIPKAHWLSSVMQTGAVESALAGFGLVIASRTRGVATFIIAAVVGLATLFFLVGALGEVRRLLDWPGYVQMADPLKALWAMITICALLLPLLFVVAMAGARRQRAFLAGVLAVLVLCVGVWFLPALRFVPPAWVDARLQFDANSLTFEPVPGTPGAVAIVLHPTPSGGHPRDQWRFWMTHGQVLTPAGRKRVQGTPAGVVPRMQQQELSVVLAVLTPQEFTAMTGSRARFVGELQGDVERRITEATATQAAGESLDTGHFRLSITRLLDGTPDPSRRMRPVIAATEIHMASPRMAFRHGHSYALRDRTSGCEVVAYRWETNASRVMPLALLPTLMPPFTVSRIELAESLQPTTCQVDPARTDLEVRTNEIRPAMSVPVSLDFTLPDAAPVVALPR